MTVTIQRRIIDFAEDGVRLAQIGPGELAEGLDVLIARLAEEGLLDELLAHKWIKRPAPEAPEALDQGSQPKRKGCLTALPFVRAILRGLGFWFSPRQIVNDPPEVRS
ncbi:MAG: hypothetical protein ACREKH_15345 [Candidatus Rokuibacteriota bacterium]